MTQPEQKTISKEFIKVDDENFEVKETRETTTPVNHKRVNIELKTFKSNLKTDVMTIMKNENAIKVWCERFNMVVDDLLKANEELKIDMVIPERISYEQIKQEIIDEEKSIKDQQEAQKVKEAVKENADVVKENE